MSGDVQASIANLIRQHYNPVVGLADLLRSFLRVAIIATNSTQGSICLKGSASGIGGHEGGILIVDNDATETVASRPLDAPCRVCVAFYEHNRMDPLMADNLKSEGYCFRVTPPWGSSLAIPIRYQRTAMGVMAVASNQVDLYPTPSVEAGQLVASEIAHQAKRYELSRLVQARVGKDLMLVGTSDALRRVDGFIRKASQVELPALIIGEFGSEKEHVAYALHFGGPRRDSPFVEVDCSTLDPPHFKMELSDLFSQADQGTIFFNGIDELEYKLQCQISEVFKAGIGQWMGRTGWGKPVDVRIVASASRDLEEMVRAGGYCETLLGELDFLRLRIAPLRERKEDIKPLIEYFLRKYASGQPRSISDEVVEVCEAYSWLGNVSEVERVIARLASMSEDETIRMRDVYAQAPKLVEGLPKSHREGLVAAQLQGSAIAKGTKVRWRKPMDPRVIHLACDLIKGELTELQRFHPSLQKALTYLAQNFQEDISLSQLARQACLSASHLSSLFQGSLGVSFKPFLTIMRIEKAKHLLVERRYLRITELCGEVGFEDLRHFERTFKRLVGCAPREYRRRALAQRKS